MYSDTECCQVICYKECRYNFYIFIFLYISFMQILCGFSHFLWCYLYQMSIIFYCNILHLFIYFLQWVCILWMLFFIRSLMFRNVDYMIFITIFFEYYFSCYTCILMLFNIVLTVEIMRVKKVGVLMQNKILL